MQNNIMEQLAQNYENFTKSEKKIADYILSHKRESQYISITDLSSNCGVAVSTVSVFCRKLGLKNFNSLKVKLAKAIVPVTGVTPDASAFGEISAGDSLEQVMQKTYHLHESVLQQTIRLLDPGAVSDAVDLLSQAREVVCLGKGSHSIIAQSAFARFSTVSPKFKTTQDTDFQKIAVSTLGEQDVVLYFSYTGATPELLDLLQILKERHVKLILVTRLQRSPGADSADCVLLFGCDEPRLLFGSTSAMIAQMYVVDVLFNEYSRRNYEEASQIRTFVGSAITKNRDMS